MEKLIKSVENVHCGRYDLRASDLLEIEERFHGDTFGLIGFVFRLGFARGQKAVKNGKFH